jgi:23S rRNA (uridine2552-2'-O)-methyltransferase
VSRPKNPYAKPDRFTRQAKDEGYAARSVYKLREIDARTRLFAPGQRVVDLGCAPGSWSQLALERIGRRGRLVGVDITEMTLPGAVVLHASVLEVTPDALRTALEGPADIVLSDMAPLTTGNALLDHVVQIELATCAFTLACAVLVPGGHFVCKIFDGEDAHAFIQSVRPRFEDVRRVRPEAVRQNSREFFLVARGHRPAG